MTIRAVHEAFQGVRNAAEQELKSGVLSGREMTPKFKTDVIHLSEVFLKKGQMGLFEEARKLYKKRRYSFNKKVLLINRVKAYLLEQGVDI